MKKFILKVSLLIFLIFLVGCADRCVGQLADYYYEYYYILDEDIVDEIEEEEEAVYDVPVQIPRASLSSTIMPREGWGLNKEPELPGKIAVIVRQDWINPLRVDDWVVKLVERYGASNVLVYILERRNATNIDNAAINEIIRNNEVRALIISSNVSRRDYIVDLISEQRDDIFIFQSSHLDISLNANLILGLNSDEMITLFPKTALEMGANTLIYFYDTSWNGGLCRRNKIREISEEIGLLFVKFDVDGAIQCGSSYHMFMTETIPLLIEKFEQNIVLFNLCNERVFWNWGKFIYVVQHPTWFELDPINLAQNLWYSFENVYDIPIIIDKIRNHFETEGQQGRFASIPISTRTLFPLAAAEYSIKWMNGEVPNEGIDIYVLERIMNDLVYEYTGIWSNVRLTAVYENYVLVTLDYFIY